MPGPICILTAGGMICEAPDSYEHHYHKGWESAAGKKCHMSHEIIPGTYPERVAMLKVLAGVSDGNYMIIEKPAVGRILLSVKGGRARKRRTKRHAKKR